MSVTRSPPSTPAGKVNPLVENLEDEYIDSDDRMAELTSFLQSYMSGFKPNTRIKGENPVYAMFTALEVLTEQIGELCKDVQKSNSKLDSVLDRISSLEAGKVELEGRVDDNETRVTSLENGTLQETVVSGIDDRIDEIDQRSLQCKLTLSTTEPILAVGRSTSKLRSSEVQNFLKSNLHLPDSELKSISAYQMDSEGKKFGFEVADPGLKRKLFSKCRELKPTGFFINEFLTKKRHNLVYNIRKLKESTPRLLKAFTDVGRVFVVVRGLERPKLVNTMDDVKNCLLLPPTAQPDDLSINERREPMFSYNILSIDFRN